MSLAIVVFAVFIAGTATGYFIAMFLAHLGIAKKERTEKVIVRSRILADIKQQHEQEVLQQIFKTVDAIHTDTENSLSRLVNNIQNFLLALHEKAGNQGKRNSNQSGEGFYLLKNEDKSQEGKCPPSAAGVPFSSPTNAGHEQ